MNDLLAAVRSDATLGTYAAELALTARNSIRLRSFVPDEGLPLGASKIGGHPDVPAGFAWPTRRIDMPQPSLEFMDAHPDLDRPPPGGVVALEFIAQINLADAAAFDADGILPRDGLLLFFYDDHLYTADVDPERSGSYDQHPDGTVHHTQLFGYDEVDQARVIHIPGGTALHRDDSGPRAYGRLAVEFSPEPTLPSVDAYVLRRSPVEPDDREGCVVLPAEAWDRYAKLEYQLRANANIDQMLGWADNFTHGPSLPPDAERAWAKLTHAERLAVSNDARLLLQLSMKTCDWTGMRYGRDLYFYVRESALREGDLSGAWYDMD